MRKDVPQGTWISQGTSGTGFYALEFGSGGTLKPFAYRYATRGALMRRAALQPGRRTLQWRGATISRRAAKAKSGRSMFTTAAPVLVYTS